MGMSRSSVLRIAGLPFQLQSMPWEEERKRTQAYLLRLVMSVRNPSGKVPVIFFFFFFFFSQAAQLSNFQSTVVLTCKRVSDLLDQGTDASHLGQYRCRLISLP